MESVFRRLHKEICLWIFTYERTPDASGSKFVFEYVSERKRIIHLTYDNVHLIVEIDFKNDVVSFAFSDGILGGFCTNKWFRIRQKSEILKAVRQFINLMVNVHSARCFAYC